MLNQLTFLAENVCKALPSNERTRAINAQVKRMKSRKEKWPDKILHTWLKRILPLFSPEAITKLQEAYLSWVEEVNETRKRQREALKSDMCRQKR